MKKMHVCRMKNKEIFIGLEDAKRTWKISVRCEKVEIDYMSMPAAYPVFQRYLRTQYPGCTVRVIYEAGFRGYGLHDRLREDGYYCVVTPPNRVTQEKARLVKTDRIDCRRLAVNLENGDYTSCFVPDKERRADRQINRTLNAIQKEIVSTRNRIRKLFDFHWIEAGLPAGAWTARDYEKALSLRVEGSIGTSLEIYKDLLKRLTTAKKLLLNELRAMTKKEKYARAFKIVSSAPGIGWQTAMRLILEWGEDLSRFKTGKEFASFNGLTCSEYSTGETVHKGHITGQGNRYVRSYLIESAWMAYKRDPVLLGKFMSVLRNSKSKKKAIVAVARKLAVRVWWCLVHGEEYQYGLLST